MRVEIDHAAPARSGEELPVGPLEAYLRQHLHDLDGPLTVEQFPHGHSNLTYLLHCGTREFVLRRPPFGNQVKTAHDMGREYRVLSRLHAIFPVAPQVYLFCEDESILGAPFYVMERRRGVILRRTLPSTLSIDPTTARRLSLTLIDNLAHLHSLDYQAAGLGDLGKPQGYVARQVTGWTKRYLQARTEDLPALEFVARWLNEHMPPESGAALIHNDFKYDNLVLDPSDLTRLVAVLDWEMATIGDPLMDLGSSLGYWIEANDPELLQQSAFGPTTLPGSLTRHELVERYQEQTGRTVANALFYYCYGLFKLAVIVQQIYARYVRGFTRDPRFAQLNTTVALLGQQAERALQRGQV
jgi:aminoglycoside phosphotransferase (APT) family kinase protein